MRKVMVMDFKNGNFVDKGEAVFHQFGCDFMESSDGNVNYSTAIVEWPDGLAEGVSLHYIRFLDKVPG